MCAYVILQYTTLNDLLIVTVDYVETVLQRTFVQSPHWRLKYMQSSIGQSITPIATLAAAVS